MVKDELNKQQQTILFTILVVKVDVLSAYGHYEDKLSLLATSSPCGNLVTFGHLFRILFQLTVRELNLLKTSLFGKN